MCGGADLVPAVRVGGGQLARARARRAAAQRRGAGWWSGRGGRGGRRGRRGAARGARGGLAARRAQHQAVARHGGGARRHQEPAHHRFRRQPADQTLSYYGMSLIAPDANY